MTKTPNSAWEEEIAGHKNQCKRVMKISDAIRYVGVINMYGRTLAGIIRPTVKPMLPREYAVNEFFMLSTLVSLRRHNMDYIGDMDHSIIYHKKVTIVLIPRGNDIVYVSLDRNADNVNSIIVSIKTVIKPQATPE